MPLSKAKCTNCGATLEVDDSKEAAICPNCHKAYVVEDAVSYFNTENNYNYNTTNQTKADVENIYGNNDDDIQIRDGVLEKYNGASKDVVIPNNVVKIGDAAFKGYKGLRSVTIPDTVTTIGEEAFFGCNSLSEINIPKKVREIGRRAFYECNSLKGVDIPHGSTVIREGTFAQCESLAVVTIPNSIVKIENNAFTNCRSLGDIALPASIAEIGEEAFYGCESLGQVVIPQKVTAIRYNCFAHCVAMVSVTIPSNVTKIEPYAFLNCGSLAAITLPESITELGEGAFWNCSNLTNIAIPRGIKRIENNTFLGCSRLTSATLSEGLKEIGEMAFRVCSCLAGIFIPDSVNKIERYAFLDCTSLADITLPGSFVYIGEGAFQNCPATPKQRNLNIHDDKINQHGVLEARRGSATDVTMKRCRECGALSPNDTVFCYVCGTKFGNTGENENAIEDGFSGGEEKEKALEQEAAVKSALEQETAEKSALEQENARKATIYRDALRMAESSDVSKLKKAIDTFETISDYEDSLNQIERAKERIREINANNEAQKEQVLKQTAKRRKMRKILLFSSAAIVILAISTVIIYRYIQLHKCGDNLKWKFDKATHTMTISGTGPMDDYWQTGDFEDAWNRDEDLRKINNVIIEEGCTSIGRRAFSWFGSLTSVSIPETVTSIQDEAFAGDYQLTHIELPSGLKEIGSQAFLDTELTSLHIPASVEIIEMLEPPESLKEITVDENNPYFIVVDGVLYDHSITTLVGYPVGMPSETIEIPDGVTSINFSSGLWKAPNLISITLPQSLSEFAVPDHLYVEAPENDECVIYYLGTKEQWMANPYSGYIDANVECSDGLFTVETYMAGIWYGDAGSSLTLREDMTCVFVNGGGYSQPDEGTWQIVDGRVSIQISALSYELYGYLEKGSTPAIGLMADSNNWTYEYFCKSDGTDADKGYLSGTWYGDAGSSVVLRKDLTCSYVDGSGISGEGTWDVVDNELRVYVSALNYDLYGYLENMYSSTSVCFKADTDSWRDEVFSRSESEDP